jgi:Recombination endonuclease VII
VALKACRACGQHKPLDDFYMGYTKCKECAKQHSREVYAAGTSKTRSYDGVFEGSLKRNYGMTLAEYDRLHAAQGGLCAVCHQPETMLRRNGLPYRLSVDHNRSGRVRALLCRRCHQIVWAFEEHAGLFAAVTRYLERFDLTPETGPELPAGA